VEEFTITIKGECQTMIGTNAIACAADGTFEYQTTIKVPKVCVEIFTLTEAVFPAELKLYQSLNPDTTATLFTPNSTLCGKLTITPTDAIDMDWIALGGDTAFDITKVRE
jgi:hypothetical protein